MKEFKVTVETTGWGEYFVLAKSAEEAREIWDEQEPDRTEIEDYWVSRVEVVE